MLRLVVSEACPGLKEIKQVRNLTTTRAVESEYHPMPCARSVRVFRCVPAADAQETGECSLLKSRKVLSSEKAGVRYAWENRQNHPCAWIRVHPGGRWPRDFLSSQQPC